MPRIGTSTSATARTARRKVPSPPRTTRASVVGELADEGLLVARLGLPVVDAAHLAPAGGAGTQLDGRLDRRVVGEPDPLDGHAASVHLGDPLADLGAIGARAEVDQELAVALRAGDRRGDDRARAEAVAPGALDRSLEDLAVDRRVADDAVVGAAPAGLELRLDERDDRAAPARERRRDRAEDEVERDERHVDRREVDRLGQRRGGQLAGVRALHRHDARVAAERFGKLSAAHVESVDARRAALQQDVREAAGRGADVERDPARRVDLERIERRRQLVAAAADVRRRFA